MEPNGSVEVLNGKESCRRKECLQLLSEKFQEFRKQKHQQRGESSNKRLGQPFCSMQINFRVRDENISKKLKACLGPASVTVLDNV